MIDEIASSTTNPFSLIHLPRTKWSPFWHTTISNAFSSMKITEFWFEFHWNLFPGVWLRISNYLNQCCTSPLMRICDSMGRWVKYGAWCHHLKYFPHHCPFVRGIIIGFLLWRVNDAGHWCFNCFPPEKAIEQIVELPVIWDAMMLMWGKYNYCLNIMNTCIMLLVIPLNSQLLHKMKNHLNNNTLLLLALLQWTANNSLA